MTDRRGTPVWYELATDEPDAAQDFYGPLMGWPSTGIRAGRSATTARSPPPTASASAAP